MNDRIINALRKIAADWDPKQYPQSPLAFKRPVRPIAGGTAWEDARTGRDLIPGYDGRSDFEMIPDDPPPLLNPRLRPTPFHPGKYEYKETGRDYRTPAERLAKTEQFNRLAASMRPTLNPRLPEPAGIYYVPANAKPNEFDGPLQRRNVYLDRHIPTPIRRRILGK